MEQVLKLGSKIGINCCQLCGLDLGDSNPRQLCGKIMCDNEIFIDDEWIDELFAKYKMHMDTTANASAAKSNSQSSHPVI